MIKIEKLYQWSQVLSILNKVTSTLKVISFAELSKGLKDCTN